MDDAHFDRWVELIGEKLPRRQFGLAAAGAGLLAALGLLPDAEARKKKKKKGKKKKKKKGKKQQKPPSCTPDCEGRTCGSDGCSGSCGDCAVGEDCVAGQCEPGTCTPECDGRNCGDDGCDGSCGECEESDACFDGQCAECLANGVDPEHSCGQVGAAPTCCSGICDGPHSSHTCGRRCIARTDEPCTHRCDCHTFSDCLGGVCVFIE